MGLELVNFFLTKNHNQIKKRIYCLLFFFSWGRGGGEGD